jgi:hypothetical protein
MKKNTVKKKAQVKLVKVHGIAQAGRATVTTHGNTVHLMAGSIRGAMPVNRSTVLNGGTNLTGKEESALNFIKRHKTTVGVMPSRRELQTFLFESGLSTQQGTREENGKIISGACSAANNVWQALENKGAIARVLASGARGSVLAIDEKQAIKEAIALLKKNGYNVAKKR